jgi:hypothetical protein
MVSLSLCHQERHPESLHWFLAKLRRAKLRRASQGRRQEQVSPASPVNQ